MHPAKQLDENVYKACVPKQQAKIDWDEVRMVDQKKYEEERVWQFNQISKDLEQLKQDLSKNMSMELSHIAEDKQGALKEIDKKLMEVKGVIESTSQ